MAQTREGAIKVAAARTGVTTDEYKAKLANGLKWCTACKEWHPTNAFVVDRSRWDGLKAACLKADRGRPRRHRDPLHEKARSTVYAAVKYGRLPHPNLVLCIDCGHLGDGPRHEYDHYLGYEPEHRLDVQVVCTLCHADREKSRV